MKYLLLSLLLLIVLYACGVPENLNTAIPESDNIPAVSPTFTSINSQSSQVIDTPTRQVTDLLQTKPTTTHTSQTVTSTPPPPKVARSTPANFQTFSNSDNGLIFDVPMTWDRKTETDVLVLHWSQAHLEVSDVPSMLSLIHISEPTRPY